MSKESEDLHGSAPDKSKTALLLIDVINDFNFPEADQLIRVAEPMAGHLASIPERVRPCHLPVSFVNDNFGRWRSDFRAQIDHCMKADCPGRQIVELLRPKKSDYFVLKPKHSGFFSTTLDTLLEYLGTRTIILTGIAANICVLFTANDAYMRDLRIFAPPDCIVSNTPTDNDHALRQIQTVLKGNLTESSRLTFRSARRSGAAQRQRRQ